MRLQDKIIHLRKQKAMSQVDLADMLEVSRQSVSNWETGSSKPDISKLNTLARTLNVSLDWLLDDSKDLTHLNEVENESTLNGESIDKSYPSWIENLPKSLSNIFRRYGWLGGFALALQGAIFAAVGFVARYAFNLLLIKDITGSLDDAIVNDLSNPGTFGPHDFYGIVEIITGIPIVLGLLVVAVGLILALYLKGFSKE